MSTSPAHTISLNTSLLIGIIILYALFELLFFVTLPTPEERQNLAQESINQAKDTFVSFVQKFETQNEQLSQDIQKLAANNAHPRQIHDLIIENYSFWGSFVYFNDSLVTWTGFPKGEHRPDLFITDLPFSATIIRDGNLVYIMGEKSFQASSGTDSISIHLVTLERLSQSNTLGIGGASEVSVQKAINLNSTYPVYFSFSETPPDDASFSSPIPFKYDPATGFIYALENDFEKYLEDRSKNAAVWRFVFLSLIFVFGAVFVLQRSYTSSTLFFFTRQLITIAFGWFLFLWLIDFFEIQLLFEKPDKALLLIKLGVHSLFSALFAFSLLLFLKSEYEPPILFSPVLSSILAFLGGFSSLLLSLIISQGIYSIFEASNLSILGLDLVPTVETTLLYLFSAILYSSLLAVTGSLFLINVRFTSLQLSVITLIGFAGILSGLLTWFFVISNALWVSALAFCVVVFTSLITFLFWSKRIHWQNISWLRLILSGCFIVTILSYIPSVIGETEYREQKLFDAAQSFDFEEEALAEEIAVTLLINLEQKITPLELTDLQQQQSFITSYLKEQTLALMRDEWQSFSLSLQLIDVDGNPITEYTTNLNAPGWTKAFDTFSLEIPFEQERIRRERLRPVIRQNPLEGSPVQYSSYRQAWIPFFASIEDDTRLGWIICSVYKEKARYQKPFRSVISYPENGELSMTIDLSEYKNNRQILTGIIGKPLDVPGYLAIDEELSGSLTAEQLLIQSSIINNTPVKELFIKTKSGTVIRSATFSVTFANHAFSLTRFYLTLLIIVLALSPLLYWKAPHAFGRTVTRFKDRLTDRFILASLACLLTLIISSNYTISRQNLESVKTDLANRLKSLSSSISDNPDIEVNDIIFDSSELLNSDAILFSNLTETASTAPQIFTQNILPEKLPWSVFDALINNGNEEFITTTTFGNQELLIGYRPVVKEGSIVSVVAIPTFVRAPMFREQLLSTTSLLIGLFVVIFGVFIAFASYIAGQLTQPIEELNDGIKTISDGNLDHVLKVKSQDEIGALTQAYNVMLFRLKELQQNLVEAEREAAWKEMAQQVAHEIKNPLTPMKLSLQHLERQVKNPDVPVDLLKEQISKINTNIIEQIESLSRIASDFSNFARPIEQEFTPVIINEVLEQVVELYTHEKNIHIAAQIPDKTVTVHGVKEELRRVFINLVKNGIEAMPEGGAITLIMSEPENKHVKVSVADTGSGISKEHQHLVFVPNFSTKSSGTGLGLAIVKKIVEEHKGSIQFESKEGGGTMFTLILPVLQN